MDRDTIVHTLVHDPQAAPLAPADRALLDYALKLTHAPASVTPADIDGLRLHGFDDRAIHDACCITAYYAFVNRIADGLGVELEPERER